MPTAVEIMALPSAIIPLPIAVSLWDAIRSQREEATSNSDIPNADAPTVQQTEASPSLNSGKTSRSDRVKFSLGLVLCVLVAVSAIGALAWSRTEWVLVVVLSLIWSPPIQKYTLDKRKNNTGTLREQSTRWMAGIINGLCKLVVVIGLAVGMLFTVKERPESVLSVLSTELKYVAPFVIVLGSSLGAYLLSWLAFKINMHFFGFYFPLAASSIATIVFVFFPALPCRFSDALNNATFCSAPPYDTRQDWTFYALVALELCELAAIVFIGWKRLKTYPLVSEEQLFIHSWYAGPFVGQSLIVNLKTKLNFEDDIKPDKKKMTIFIASTMYQESRDEQARLFKSIQSLYKSLPGKKEKRKDYNFEWHIWFDNATEEKSDETRVNVYVTTLLDIFKDNQATFRSRHELPYGVQIKVRLEGDNEETATFPVVIHLKDTTKWKKKKRWSQVMYMQYVCDFRRNQIDTTYVLTTDGDVEFEPEDVDILLDRLNMDERVGGVSGRVYPEGDGPVVWYQEFEYAAGYWLQKVAEHVIGTVMCSPGCFSAFRAKDLAKVLPEYSKNVKEASDFLKMDMGEDRWLSTLLIRENCRLDYAASSKCKTKCPESFDDLYKQRRRWIPSTLANMFYLGSVSWSTWRSNEAYKFFFVFYVIVFILSTVIGPATILLVMAAGLEYSLLPATGNRYVIMIVSLYVIAFIIFFYVWVCFYCCEETQLFVAKVLTFFFAFVMAGVLIGVVLQVASGLQFKIATPTARPLIIIPPGGSHNVSSVNESISLLGNSSSVYDKLSSVPVSTWYLGGMIFIFFTVALLHISDFFVLFKGLLYLFCLPSGYILMTVFAVCNLTNQSWGTREKSKKSENDGKTLYGRFVEGLVILRKCCCYCFRDQRIDVRIAGRQITTHEVNERGIQVGGTSILTMDRSEEDSEEYKEDTVLTSIPNKQLDGDELKFWNDLQDTISCLKVNNGQAAEKATKEAESKLEENLKKLRSYWLWIFITANTLWIVLNAVLELHPALMVRHSNVLGSMFILVYGITFVVQFFACIWNRFETLIHYLSRRNSQENRWNCCCRYQENFKLNCCCRPTEPIADDS